MQSRVDDRFRHEVRRYGLLYTCESCVHYDTGRRSCANGYSTDPHRQQDLMQLRQLSFCKTFELC
jgi:hypothetical protein